MSRSSLPTSASRRTFLKSSGALFGAAAFAGAFQSLGDRLRAGENTRQPLSFGPLVPSKDRTTGLELLKLPEGFEYISFGWESEPLTNGGVTPAMHDGMAVIAADKNTVTLCRNHEVDGDGPAFGDPSLAYDPHAGGGCTNLIFDTQQGKLLKSWSSISGTSRNCAGGPTPWGTWLTCEETVHEPGEKDDDGKLLQFEKTHGWIFEVPRSKVERPQPLRAMGRFVHEAIAVDPRTGIVYESEDQPAAGFYRFLPQRPGKLAAGGKLQMMKLAGVCDTRLGQNVNQLFDVSWVDIEDPEKAHAKNDGKLDGEGVYQQGKQQGAATFGGLEGCWHLDGRIFFTAKSGGDAKRGQVWEYIIAEEKLRLAYQSAGPLDLNMPDNITASPRGGLVICEDGDEACHCMRLQCLTRDGRLSVFAVNQVDLTSTPYRGFKQNYSDSEWAGATFSPDGKWLFVNIQTPGITFAITGPWRDGLL